MTCYPSHWRLILMFSHMDGFSEMHDKYTVLVVQVPSSAVAGADTGSHS